MLFINIIILKNEFLIKNPENKNIFAKLTQRYRVKKEVISTYYL